MISDTLQPLGAPPYARPPVVVVGLTDNRPRRPYPCHTNSHPTADLNVPVPSHFRYTIDGKNGASSCVETAVPHCGRATRREKPKCGVPLKMTKRTYFPASASDSRLYNEKVVFSLSRPDSVLIPADTPKKSRLRLNVKELMRGMWGIGIGGFPPATGGQAS